MIDVRFLKSALFYAVSLFGVQGTIYFLQVVSATQASADDYSVIRLTESAAAVGAILVSFGIPSAVLVKVAASATRSEANRITAASLALIGLVLVVAALLYFVVARGFGIQPSIIVGVLTALVSLRLLLTGVTQAHERFSYLAFSSAGGCVASIGGFYLLRHTGFPALQSWIAARCMVEVVLVAALALGEGRSLFARQTAEPEPHTSFASTLAQLSTFAVPVGSSLVLRSLVEHGPVLLLSAIASSKLIVAQVGLITTVGTIALVPATVVQAVVIPRVARGNRVSAAAVLFAMLAAGAVLTAVLNVVLLKLTEAASSWGFVVTTGIAAWSGLIVASKMTAGFAGGLLLAQQKGNAILFLNMATVGVALAATAAFWSQISAASDASGVLWTIAGIELVGAALYMITIFRVRRSG